MIHVLQMTAWEHSLRVPLIISAPWLPSTHGKMHSGMAEMCDFYRTLSDLAGIDPSTVDKGVQCDGLASVFSDPNAAGKTYAFSQTQRIGIPSLQTEPMECVRDCRNMKTYKKLPPVADGFYAPSCFSYNHQIQYMVYTVRSSEWRLTKSLRWDGQKLCAIKPRASANTTAHTLTELYDHRNDTTVFDLDVAEYDNVVASYPGFAATMLKALETYVVYCPA
jgi:hypothetical protein